MTRVLTCIFTQHNLWLLLLVVLLCGVGAAITMRLYRRALESIGLLQLGWLFLTAVCAGNTVWAMHFIAMVAYRPGVPVGFSAIPTLLSLLVAIVGTWIGFTLSTLGRSVVFPIAGGLAIGLTISAMHFIGMHGYHLDASVTVDRRYTIAAVVLAVTLSLLAMLAVRQHIRSSKHFPAVTLAFAIKALHFTAMAAMTIHIVPGALHEGSHWEYDAMALAVAVASIVMLGVGLAGYLIDNHMRTSSTEQLKRMALHDPLTGLPNRTMFHKHLAKALAKRQSRNVAVIGIDLNRFKEINDIWGHPAGDKTLNILAERLRGFSDHDSFVSRIGGDEFSAIVCFESQSELQERLESLEDIFNSRIAFGSLDIIPGASIGIAIAPRDGADGDTLVRNADIAMYRAKQDTVNDVYFYDQEMGDYVREQRLLSNDLRHAIDNGELDLHYQVQTTLHDGSTCGYEALLRWSHPTLGAIPPSRFIPLAEANGLILRIGEWVLRRACRDAAAWEEPHKVAVNLSAVQLLNPQLSRQVEQVLLETGLRPEQLELELTETALIKDKQRSLHIIERIKALGVNIALDDFGTGFSSLETLRAFPFDKIKLDRSFLEEMDDQRSLAFIRAVMALGKNLSIPILAEGIETQEQLEFLKQEACDEGQGFLFGSPTPTRAGTERPIASNLPLPG